MLSWVPQIVAHRGLHKQYPENSIGAMRAGWAAGIQWCETDVHLSADNQVVVMHDEKLDRMTTVKGEISARTWDELKKIPLVDAKRKPTSEHIPLLQDFLDIMPPDAGLLVEIKPPMTKPQVQRVLEVIRGRKCIVQSFHQQDVQYALELEPSLTTAYLIDRAENVTADGGSVSVPFEAINAQFRSLDAELVRFLKSQGRTVGAWTVNKEADIVRMKSIGVQTIISDEPLLVRGILAR